MLNKELLLLATEGQIGWHTKLTVGSGGNSVVFGYSKATEIFGIFGSISKVPCWNAEGKPYAMLTLISNSKATELDLEDFRISSYINEITVTVVEKKLTTTLKYSGFFGFTSNQVLFNSSDVGKTFTIIFDPEPTGYA